MKFNTYEILKDTGIRLWPYFKPSLKNVMRTTALASAVALPIISNIIVNAAFLTDDNDTNNTNDSESGNDHKDFNIMMSLASVTTIALFTAAQYAISTFLTTSTMQAMKEDNVKLLMDEKSKFLMHGDVKGISSLQYPTVGLGTRDFAGNAVTMLVGMPMYTISSLTSLVNIATVTNVTTSAVIFAFIGGSITVSFACGKAYMFYQQHNQEIENKLVGRVGFIEAHREAITLMKAVSPERVALLEELDRVTSTIPKLTILNFSNDTVIAIATSIASQFLGGYYKNDFIPNLDNTNAKVLNIMITLLMSSMVQVVQIMAGNYTYTKLNLKELNALEKAHKDCLLVHNTNNKMQLKFLGNKLSIINLSVYKTNSEDVEILESSTMFDNLNINLDLDKIYKLSGKSASGKTTLLKAITNNWQYTDGIVSWPANAENNIYFIPQHTFIPPGTLVEVLTYPFKPKDFLKNYFTTEDNLYTNSKDETTFLTDYEMLENENIMIEPMLSQVYQLNIRTKDEQSFKSKDIPKLISKIKQLLKEVKLLPNAIRENEIESENIKWYERLSGGEIQKIGIVRALLTECQFIIMDESTSALDLENREIVYQVIKKHISKLKNHMIIYTEHGFTPNFADVVLEINGQNLSIKDSGEGHNLLETTLIGTNNDYGAIYN